MKKFFLRNPWLRSLVPLLLMGTASIAANSLVVEISFQNRILWSQIPEKDSFYIFIIATILLCSYQVQIFKYDKNIILGITAKQYEATIRNKVAEGVAERSKKLIREGQIEQLEKETEIFCKLFGEVKQ